MAIRFYNTLSRIKEEFVPLKTGQVGMYTCGPTVYDYAHIGNLRTYIFEDVLRRVLEYNGLQVNQVMNITDVGHLESDADSGEDKMEKGSRRTGKTAWEIAEEYTLAFQKDLRDLNIQEPHIWCKATGHIKEQIETIECIEKKGYTYRTSDGIYFDTAKLKKYGVLTKIVVQDLMAGARIEMGEKKHPTDFALWKFSPEGTKRQMEWESPWGKGFPGWHIECSAMAARYLGPLFDIHCGGEDAIAVHHTNEIAQTQACHGTNLANYWLHGYFLQLGQEKMAKSSGEFLTLQVLMDKGYDPLAYRYFCFTGHYRSQLSFTYESLTAAQRALENLRAEVKKLDPTPIGNGEDKKFGGSGVKGYKDKFLSAINDDLNMPQVLAIVWDMLKDNKLIPGQKIDLTKDFDKVLGLKLTESAGGSAIPAEVEDLILKRQEARTAKNWAESDRLRNEISNLGFVVEDGPKGQAVRPKKFGE